jgi:mono/diheme cytochrome c family protein
MAHVPNKGSGLAVLLLVALAGCRGNPSEEAPVHLQQNMDFQERGDPQERNDFFADGRVMRPPVEGTVAYGHLKEDDHLWRGRLPNGQLADALPPGMELTPALLDRGQQRYDIYCAPCHDRAGTGRGMIVQRGYRPPPSFHIDRLRQAPAGHFFDVMTNGFGAMPDYRAQIAPVDRWAIAAYIRALQLTRQPAPAQTAGRQGAAREERR